VPDLPGKVKSAYLLADASKKPLEWTPGSGGDANEIALPAKAPSEIDSVVVVECE
jgi:hypothetical protein